MPRTIRMEQTTKDQEARRSQEDCGIQELGGIGETGRSKVPNVRRVRESEIREIMLFIST